MIAKQPITFRATAANPCPVCETGSKGCSGTGDGLYLCRDEPADPAAWKLMKGEDAAGFRSFRHVDHRRTPTPSNKKLTPSKNWHTEAKRFAQSLTPALRQELADALRLPVDALDALPLIGWDGHAWTFPECDGRGTVIGIARRFRGGVKGFHTGGQRGLTLPAGWEQRPGPWFVAEGASDQLAMTPPGCVASAGRATAAGRSCWPNC